MGDNPKKKNWNEYGDEEDGNVIALFAWSDIRQNK